MQLLVQTCTLENTIDKESFSVLKGCFTRININALANPCYSVMSMFKILVLIFEVIPLVSEGWHIFGTFYDEVFNCLVDGKWN